MARLGCNQLCSKFSTKLVLPCCPIQEDVHRVFAPGKIYFIKRLDKHKGRAKYGNTVHVCALCQSDDVVPPPDHDHGDEQASRDATSSATPDAAAQECVKYELIEAAPKQRFERIVLRETCLMDHLTGGYVQGLKFALEQAKQKQG